MTTLEIKEEFVQTGTEYNDLHGGDIPTGYIKKWVSVDNLKNFMESSTALTARTLQMEILKELEKDTCR